MFKTFVLINCEPGKEPEVLQQLHKLAHIISDQIRKISNINTTLTLIPTEEHKSGLADLIPDIIPEQKKPLEEPPSENDEDDLDDYNDDE